MMQMSFSDRSNGYGVFKDVMQRPNDPKGYRALAAWAREAGRIAFAELCEGAANNTVDSEASYNRLCVGPGRLLADPYESIWRSGERVLNNHYTATVAYAYAEVGIVPERKGNEMADYFPNELEFLFALSVGSLRAGEEGQPELAEAYAETHDLFWSQHLGHWALPFLERFSAESDNEFWRTFGIELKYFLGRANGDIELSEEILGLKTQTEVVIQPPKSLKGSQK